MRERENGAVILSLFSFFFGSLLITCNVDCAMGRGCEGVRVAREERWAGGSWAGMTRAIWMLGVGGVGGGWMDGCEGGGKEGEKEEEEEEGGWGCLDEA